jgi:ketosteroid isomerase-like protein
MSTISNTQRLTTAYVHQIFRNLESGDGKRFFDHIADNVDWIVEGTHPLAGHYTARLTSSQTPSRNWLRFCHKAHNSM